ncbi:alpha/beta-hydrolase [Coprinopsis marcescibilis]|uniref:Alpha/beta-hydrolase n=1 Tax=Coprinopsis marcescibilis TaxID=230819 RepID=A0A5C3KMJ5_COPMA|nr:alpha/beta-hydrolase [Coprinopsis marcescibilis]
MSTAEHGSLELSAGTQPSLSFLAGTCESQCLEGPKHVGIPKGETVTIAGVPTYVSKASAGHILDRVVFFFSDALGPFFINNQLLQDYFASQGYHVFGLDYFFGDPVQKTRGQPDFNQTVRIEKSYQQADASVPGWIQEVKKGYGPNTKYNAVGYCFGGRYALTAGSTDDVVSAAFAHPAFLTEDHFEKLTKMDDTFSADSRRRAEDILSAKSAKYHVQVFSGVAHGFATRSDPNNPHAGWAREQSAKSIVEWFNRFSK